MTLTFRHEPMAGHFDKYHIEGLDKDLVLHHITAPDLGDPHDHPWSFESQVLLGGYVEEVYNPFTGEVHEQHRRRGKPFFVPSHHVHRIVHVSRGGCLTAIRPYPEDGTRTSGFYRREPDQTLHRYWHEARDNLPWQPWPRS